MGLLTVFELDLKPIDYATFLYMTEPSRGPLDGGVCLSATAAWEHCWVAAFQYQYIRN